MDNRQMAGWTTRQHDALPPVSAEARKCVKQDGQTERLAERNL